MHLINILRTNRKANPYEVIATKLKHREVITNEIIKE